MAKKTYRKKPQSQAAKWGHAAGIMSHGGDCPCRRCRRLAAKGKTQNLEQRLPNELPHRTD